MRNNNININVSPNNSSKTNWLSIGKEYFDKIAKSSWGRIIKVYFVMFFFLATILSGFVIYKITSDNELLNLTAKKVIDDKKYENIRDFVVTPRIQHDLKILVYSLNAERVFLFELHNGKKNTTGLPFRFADMTYEETNEDKKVDKIAMEFQDIPLTLYKFPHYLQKEKVMIGSVEKISEIDVDYADHIKRIGGKYLGMVYMTNGSVPLGFLCVSYHSMEDKPSDEVIKTKLLEYDKVITQLLDLQVQLDQEND